MMFYITSKQLQFKQNTTEHCFKQLYYNQNLNKLLQSFWFAKEPCSMTDYRLQVNTHTGHVRVHSWLATSL